MGFFEWMQQAEQDSKKRKEKRAEKVENAPIQVGDQVISLKGKGRVKKGTKGVCTNVQHLLGQVQYTVIFDTGYAIGNKPNPVKILYSEFERSYSIVKINT